MPCLVDIPGKPSLFFLKETFLKGSRGVNLGERRGVGGAVGVEEGMYELQM